MAVLALVVAPQMLPVDEARRIAPANRGDDQDQPRTRATAVPAPARRTAAPPDAVQLPHAAATPQPPAVPSRPDKRPASCAPLVTDPRGDVADPAIDILEGSVTFNERANTLRFTERFDDIPEDKAPRDALVYNFEFKLDGMSYFAQALNATSIDAEWSFGVLRHDRRAHPSTNSRRSVLEHVSGSVDPASDTVQVGFDIDEFNRGERRAAEAEGLPPQLSSDEAPRCATRSSGRTHNGSPLGPTTRRAAATSSWSLRADGRRSPRVLANCDHAGQFRFEDADSAH